MKIFNNSGFSMVQIMMAAAMMGVLSLGLMKLMENQRKSAHSVKTSAAAHDFYIEAKAYFARPGYCTKNFLGVKLAEGDELELTNILKSNGNILYKANEIYGSSLRLESITTSNFEKDSERAALMNLKFKLSKIGNSYGASEYIKVIKLSLNLNEEGEISSCNTFGAASAGTLVGSETAASIEQGIKDLQAGKDSPESKRVKEIIEGNTALKEMSNSIKAIQKVKKPTDEQSGD